MHIWIPLSSLSSPDPLTPATGAWAPNGWLVICGISWSRYVNARNQLLYTCRVDDFLWNTKSLYSHRHNTKGHNEEDDIRWILQWAEIGGFIQLRDFDSDSEDQSADISLVSTIAQILGSCVAWSNLHMSTKNTRNHYRRTYSCKTTQKFQSVFRWSISANFQDLFPLPFPVSLLQFYHQHFFPQSRRRLVGLPPWKEVQLTSHLKGSWVLTWGY